MWKILVVFTVEVFELASNSKLKWQSKLCYDRRAVGQSVWVSSTHLRLTTSFYYCQTVWVCWCGALSLTRERVCRLQLLLVLARAVILASESRGTRNHILHSQIRDSPNKVQVTLRLTVSQSVSLGVEPHRGSLSDIYHSLTVTVLLFWGALSDEWTGLSFVYASGPRQRSLAQVRVPWDSWPYFTVSDLILPFSSPPTTRRITVESPQTWRTGSPYSHDTDHTENTVLL
jgi:hypothetical protein